LEGEIGTGIWARGKRRGFSPGAAASHSQHARVHTEFLPKHTGFFIIPSSSLPPSLDEVGKKSRVQSAELETKKWKKKDKIRREKFVSSAS